MIVCPMCDYEFDPYKDGVPEAVKGRMLLCIRCVRKMEGFMHEFGVKGGVVDTSKWGVNPPTIPLPEDKKKEEEVK